LYWSADGLGGRLREEHHFDGRRMLCYSERPPTLARMFAALVARFPDRPAIVEERTFSYRELDEIVARLAAGLAAFGVDADDKVALFLSNRWEYLAAVLACARLGAVSVPIGSRQRRPELEFLIADCGAKVLIFDDELAEAVPEPAAVPALRHLFSLRGEAPGARPFAELLGDHVPVAIADYSEERPAVILYTSGTTGRPKGALLTHIGVIHSALTFARCLGLTEEDRGLVAVPMSHVTGLVGVSLATMVVGGAVVLMRRPYKTAEFLDLASAKRITYSILVPTIYTLVGMSADLERYDLSAWRLGCFGGAPMPVATIELIARRLPQLALINAYGATETTSPTTVMPLSVWRDHIDSVGQIVPCGEVKVLDEEGRPVVPGEAGELWIAGPMVVPGYHSRSEANRTDFVDGFWRSGDIGSVDAEGFVRVFDRRKDMINRGGFKVFSAEVENVLSHHAAVQECAIVGRPDPVLGERVHAFVVPRAGESIDVESIRAFCAARLADYKVPESVTVSAEPLPRNSNGKVQKLVLRAMMMAGG
jgi:acyl-CoA synthetase (AMP-forming)/AMP-acid ligase II